MIKHDQTIRQQKPPNFVCVFDSFVGLTFNGLSVCLQKGHLVQQKLKLVNTT